MTKSEYMEFFERWLNYQFSRVEDEWDNYQVLKSVADVVSDPDELEHWSSRDCWSMYDLVKVSLK